MATRAPSSLKPSLGLARDLAHAVTRYDRAQARGKRYNPNALGLYLARCEGIARAVRRGATLQSALGEAFTDRLRDRVAVYLRERGHPVTP